MSLDISISLSDADLKLFVDSMKEAQSKARQLDAAGITSSARKVLSNTNGNPLPDFVKERLRHLDTMINMVEDTGFGLPEEDRQHVLSALAYFATSSDAVPDNIPVLGFIDDAIMIELCVRELTHEIEAYRDFRQWRDNEASRHSANPAELMLTRVEWAEARREETIERMHRRREASYASGSWSPLFRVY